MAGGAAEWLGRDQSRSKERAVVLQEFLRMTEAQGDGINLASNRVQIEARVCERGSACECVFESKRETGRVCVGFGLIRADGNQMKMEPRILSSIMQTLITSPPLPIDASPSARPLITAAPRVCTLAR